MTASNLFTKETKAIIYGLQEATIQRMLDFDFTCRRSPSIPCIITEGRHTRHKAFWGEEEILIPTYPSITEAVKKHSDADVLINFSSFRSAFDTSSEALSQPTINTVIIIAEGVPERKARLLIEKSKKLGKTVIGPATVGGIKAGCFKAGDTGGTLNNIHHCGLYRPGNVAFISKSGGMSNESYNIISRNTNGLYEGIAIGGDRFPGSTFIEHILRWEKDPKVKMIVLLGEVGGKDEYEVADALREKRVTKPIVAWVAGSSATLFKNGVQFGHAGAFANSEAESAKAKNEALRKAGATVPESFDDYDQAIKQVFDSIPTPAPMQDDYDIPTIPADYEAAKKKGSIRRPTHFISTISDERSGELFYGNELMLDILTEDKGIGYVIGKLWFKKSLPKWATHFLEMMLVISADHGPAVAGAHNAIVTARAGKDLLSSLVSGLLTIGPRFGGALNDAGKYFLTARKQKQEPEAFVTQMKKNGVTIPGIGHKIYNTKNPDKRSRTIVSYAKQYFSTTETLDYALAVEALTQQKRDNLILNVDGAMAACIIDMMESTSMFTEDEISSIVNSDQLNAIFILSRTIGLIGHVFDQKRLKQPLYRHPWDDINYMTEKTS